MDLGDGALQPPDGQGARHRDRRQHPGAVHQGLQSPGARRADAGESRHPGRQDQDQRRVDRGHPPVGRRAGLGAQGPRGGDHQPQRPAPQPAGERPPQARHAQAGAGPGLSRRGRLRARTGPPPWTETRGRARGVSSGSRGPLGTRSGVPLLARTCRLLQPLSWRGTCGHLGAGS